MRYSPSLNCWSTDGSESSDNKKHNVKNKPQKSKVSRSFLHISAMIIAVIVMITVLVLTMNMKVLSTELLKIDDYVSVVVKRGDTLWSIAKEHGPTDEDIRMICHLIREANEIKDNIVIPGQTILVPKEV